MNPDTFANLQMPYLQAIQRIPGDTASEKLKKIGKLVSNRPIDNKDRELFDSPELQLLLQVEIAVKNKESKIIISALDSDDSTIVRRALKATWFFDGCDENNFRMLGKYVFPLVSVRTRARIVKTIGRRVKNSIFAERMFSSLEFAYGIETALPLLVHCKEKFTLDVIMKRKFMLPNGILKKIVRKNASFAAQLLWLYIEEYKTYLPNNKEFVKKKLPEVHVIQVIRKYLVFVPILAKHKPESFAYLIKRVPLCTEIIVLSNRCAKKFLKQTIHIVAKNPKTFLSIMSLKAIKAKQMEMLLPNLITYTCQDFFKTDKMLHYLRYYPTKKALELLFNAYKNFYHHDLLQDIKNVTVKLLRRLPAHQRIEAAKKLVERYPDSATRHYDVAWICYLPPKKPFPIKRFLKNSSGSKLEILNILRMLYTCIVNKDKIQLCKILHYILKKGYIEKLNTRLAEELIGNILNICSLSRVTPEIHTLVFNIIKQFFEKHGYVRQDFLENLLYFKLSNNLELTDLMTMLFITNDNQLLISFNMFTNNLRYERRCLLAFIDFIEKNYIHWYKEEERQANEDRGQPRKLTFKVNDNVNVKVNDGKKVTLCRFVLAMYHFNKKCQYLGKKHIKRITIKDYPILSNAICEIMGSPIDFKSRKKVWNVLRIYERELCCNWVLGNASEDIVVTSGAALCLLKKEPQSVLNNWERYLISCKKYYREKEVQRFLRAARWYKDIPLNFAKHCIDSLYGKDIQEMLPDLIILGILLGSNTFKKLLELLEPFLSEQMKLRNNHVDISTEDRTLTLILSIFEPCNVPVPMETVANLFIKSKSFVGKITLLRVLERVSFSDMSALETRLPMMCMLMRKHCIDVMCSIKDLQNQVHFLSAMWTVEKHWTIRENILEKCLIIYRDISKSEELFQVVQTPIITLLRQISASITFDDVHLLKKFEEYSVYIDTKYMWRYFELWLMAIKCLSEAGLHSKFTRMYTLNLLKTLDSFNSTIDFSHCMNVILFDFLFHKNADISSVMRYYALLYFSESFHKNEDREIYFKIISDVLHYIKVSRQTDFENSLICPTKNALHAFLNEFVIRFIKLHERLDYINVIDDLLNLFSLKSSRLQNAKVYLLLKYAKILHNCKKIYPFSEDNFGRELGRNLLDLIDTFSEYLVPVMTEILELFIKIIYGPNNYLHIMELILDGLMIVENKYVTFMTMTILSSMHKSDCYAFNIIQQRASCLLNITINLQTKN